MARFLLEGTASAQTMAALLKNPHDRGEALRPLFAKMGGKLEVFYYVVGRPKYYAICELPDPVDPATLVALGVAPMAQGATADFSISQILTSAEMVQGFKKATELGYRAPN